MPGKISTLAHFLPIQTNMPRYPVAAQSICARYDQMVLAPANHRNPRTETRE